MATQKTDLMKMNIFSSNSSLNSTDLNENFKIIEEEFNDRSVNVKWFGAKGDGSTDDTTAIQNAVNYVKSMGTGTVYFPDGTYMISATIYADFGRFALAGAGGSRSVIRGTATHKGVLVQIGNRLGNKRDNVVLRGMTFQNSGGDGLHLENVSSYLIDDCQFNHNKGHGLYAYQSWVGVVNASQFYRNEIDGFFSDTNVQGLSFTGAHFIENKRNGLYAPRKSSITGCIFEENVETDILIENRQGLFLGGNYFEAGLDSGHRIKIVDSNGITLEANGIGDNRSSVYVTGNSRNITISNSYSSYNFDDAFYSNYRQTYIDADCKKIRVYRNHGPVVVHPNAIKQVDFGNRSNVRDFNFPQGEFNTLIGGIPAGWAVYNGTPTCTIIPSIAGECAKALRVTFLMAKGMYFFRTISGLKPNTVYTLAALFQLQSDGTKGHFGFYGAPETTLLPSDGRHYYNFNGGPTVATAACKSDSAGKLKVGFGSNQACTYDIEWFSVLEGYYDPDTFPRKYDRFQPNVLQSPDGSYFLLKIDNQGAICTQKL